MRPKSSGDTLEAETDSTYLLSGFDEGRQVLEDQRPIQAVGVAHVVKDNHPFLGPARGWALLVLPCRLLL